MRGCLRWDVLGSLGHVEGLRAEQLHHADASTGACSGCFAARCEPADAGRLVDRRRARGCAFRGRGLAHPTRSAAPGERLHTGRSRNDQVACDLRLYLKDRAAGAAGAAPRPGGGAARVRGDATARRCGPATPTSAARCRRRRGSGPPAYAEGLLDTLEARRRALAAVDRSPLGSAAGYGVPLPLDREAAARALGFRDLDHNVAGVQNARGKLEAAVLFWCAELGHEMAKLSPDVILFSAEEFGCLRLPADLATGSSIMPQKRNPDLFELTRARSALVEGDLVTVLHLKAKLPGGYHRDFQLLKEPLLRGLDPTDAMLAMLALAVPRLEVDRARGRAALTGDSLATDEVIRRTRAEASRSARPTARWPASSRAGARCRRSPIASSSRGAARIRRPGQSRARLARARVARARALVAQRERRRFDDGDAQAGAGRVRAMTADRRKRQLKILELISTRAVQTQEELADALAADGWEVTQSSVSRDIAALRLVKVDGAYQRARPRRARARDPDELRIAEGVLTVEPAGDALVVLHTPPGEANRVGSRPRPAGLARDRRDHRGRRHHLPRGLEPGCTAAGREAAPGDRDSTPVATRTKAERRTGHSPVRRSCSLRA